MRWPLADPSESGKQFQAGPMDRDLTCAVVPICRKEPTTLSAYLSLPFVFYITKKSIDY
jgi:hypothetical protein